MKLTRKSYNDLFNNLLLVTFILYHGFSPFQYPLFYAFS
nr:MAG TPA: hypothetical protein [Caudoviricetes sp.]DAV83328.1 MAG TPA: hypothetical protein [Caudoviricetes sp.]